MSMLNSVPGWGKLRLERKAMAIDRSSVGEKVPLVTRPTGTFAGQQPWRLPGNPSSGHLQPDPG